MAERDALGGYISVVGGWTTQSEASNTIYAVYMFLVVSISIGMQM